MVLEPLSRNPPPRFIIGDLTVDRVSQFKLLGITVSDKLKWNDHVANICFKLNKHLHFLKQLKRAGMSTNYSLFLSRVSTLTRDIDIAILSVCP